MTKYNKVEENKLFILNPPYVSNLLIDTIKKNNYKVLKNKTSVLKLSDYKSLISDEQARKESQEEEFKLYTNSEDSVEWIVNNMQNTDIPEKLNLFKDKAKFRNLLKPLYPNFYYKELTLTELKTIDADSLKYPLIIKPVVGFLSFGVYPVKNSSDFKKIILNIDNDIEHFKGVFPKEVVDASNFLIEEMIQGEEYAIDAYYNKEGQGVILNIFHHPFLGEKDVSDRVYYTSKDIMQNYLEKFEELINKIGRLADLKNFPMHLELRVSNDGIIPIEINPMRFAGWCDVDVAFYAYGINIYEYYMNDKKPDWVEILKNKGSEMYYFTGADIPSCIDKNNIKQIDYDGYLSFIKEPLDIRKIDYKTKPLFAIVIGCARTQEEIKTLLSMNLTKFIEM